MTDVPCALCMALVPVELAHTLHEPYCRGFDCWCDLECCPDCCPECRDWTSSRGGSAVAGVAPVVADAGRPSSPSSPVAHTPTTHPAGLFDPRNRSAPAPVAPGRGHDQEGPS